MEKDKKTKTKTKIVRVTYGEEDSVRIADFQYVKPRVELTAAIGDDHTWDDVLEDLKETVREKLAKYKIEILKRAKAGKT